MKHRVTSENELLLKTGRAMLNRIARLFSALKHYVAEVAKTFGAPASTTETLGGFRYDRQK